MIDVKTDFKFPLWLQPLTHCRWEAKLYYYWSPKKYLLKRSFNVIICLKWKLPIFEQLIHKRPVVQKQKKKTAYISANVHCSPCKRKRYFIREPFFMRGKKAISHVRKWIQQCSEWYWSSDKKLFVAQTHVQNDMNNGSYKIRRMSSIIIMWREHFSFGSKS